MPLDDKGDSLFSLDILNEVNPDFGFFGDLCDYKLYVKFLKFLFLLLACRLWMIYATIIIIIDTPMIISWTKISKALDVISLLILF